MNEVKGKSVTVRIDDDDMLSWINAQSSATSSIKMAIKICMLQYGNDADLADAILVSQFGGGKNIRQSSDNVETIQEQATPHVEPVAKVEEPKTKQEMSDAMKSLL